MKKSWDGRPRFESPIKIFPGGELWKTMSINQKRQWLIASGQCLDWDEACALFGRHVAAVMAWRKAKKERKEGKATAERPAPAPAARPVATFPPVEEVMTSQDISSLEAARLRLMAREAGG